MAYHCSRMDISSPCITESKRTRWRNCSSFLVISKMQIKTTLRYCLIHVRMVKIKNTDDSIYMRKHGVRSTLLHCRGEGKLIWPVWKRIWGFLRKLGINLPQGTALPLLDIYPKNTQSYHKDTYSTIFIAALFIIARTWKQHRCPLMDKWIKKM